MEDDGSFVGTKVGDTVGAIEGATVVVGAIVVVGAAVVVGVWVDGSAVGVVVGAFEGG